MEDGVSANCIIELIVLISWTDIKLCMEVA